MLPVRATPDLHAPVMSSAHRATLGALSSVNVRFVAQPAHNERKRTRPTGCRVILPEPPARTLIAKSKRARSTVMARDDLRPSTGLDAPYCPVRAPTRARRLAHRTRRGRCLQTTGITPRSVVPNRRVDGATERRGVAVRSTCNGGRRRAERLHGVGYPNTAEAIVVVSPSPASAGRSMRLCFSVGAGGL